MLSLFSDALRPPEEARRPKDILRLITYNRAREPTTEDFDTGFWRLDGTGAGLEQAAAVSGAARRQPQQLSPSPGLACSEAQTLTHALKPNVTR